MMAKLRRPIGLTRPINREPSPQGPAAPAAAPTSDGSLLLPSEAAKRLGVSEHALERWRGTGEGPLFVRLTTKTLRYRNADLEAFVASRVVASTAAG